METRTVPVSVREKLGDAGSDGLVTMFSDAHRIATESFERRLSEEIWKFRLEMVERISDLRFDILKWNFLFWIGQLAALTGILSFLLRDVR
jgi:hypothetical protein